METEFEKTSCWEPSCTVCLHQLSSLRHRPSGDVTVSGTVTSCYHCYVIMLSEASTSRTVASSCHYYVTMPLEVTAHGTVTSNVTINARNSDSYILCVTYGVHTNAAHSSIIGVTLTSHDLYIYILAHFC